MARCTSPAAERRCGRFRPDLHKSRQPQTCEPSLPTLRTRLGLANEQTRELAFRPPRQTAKSPPSNCCSVSLSAQIARLNAPTSGHFGRIGVEVGKSRFRRVGGGPGMTRTGNQPPSLRREGLDFPCERSVTKRDG
jgi:hypothetical protein